MCPLLFNSPKISDFSYGYLLQYQCKKDKWREEKIRFHKIILNIELGLKEKFPFIKILSFIGGSCELCTPCEAHYQRECKFPQKARPSLEAAGFNVIKILKELNLPYSFSKENVTWTGAIIIKF